MHKVLTILGTRPEAIKLAPVIKELSKYPDVFESVVGVTGQHGHLLQQVLNLFHIKADFNLAVMRDNQNLTDLTALILKEIGKILAEIGPDIILVQGDTTTVFAATLAAFYQKIQVGHVEAGLRTRDKYQPFPEEINRRLTDQMADFFFAPTERNRCNLLAEGIPAEKVYVTGNTVVDALLHILASDCSPPLEDLPDFEGTMVLMTAHRRENFGAPLQKIFHAVRRLADIHHDVRFVYPVHPNPNVRTTALNMLSGLKNIHLIEPLDYLSFIHLMKKSYLIMSDSGGVQEEAPSLKKPVLILRDKTERPELVEAGGAKLVGCDQELIVKEVNRLIQDKDYHSSMANISNPFGDGTAAEKIVENLRDSLGEEKEWNERKCVAY